jgi:hypothetical protein
MNADALCRSVKEARDEEASDDSEEENERHDGSNPYVWG